MREAVAAAMRSLRRNLAAGLRLALMRRVSPLAFRIDGVQLLLLFVVSCAIDVVGDRLRFGGDSAFSALGAGTELAAIAMLAGVALVVAIALRREVLALAIVVTAMASLPIVQILHYLPFAFAGVAWPTSLAFVSGIVMLAWVVAILVRCLAIHLQLPPRRRWAIAGAGAIILALPLVMSPMLVDNVPWFTAVDAGLAPDGAISAASEPVLAAQKELLDNALGAIDDRDPGTANLYFVAFAPDAGEIAWTAHMDRVQKLIEDRLDTKGHSVVLRNHADTLLTMPWATVSNLRETFAEVAAAADTRQDILMLYVGGKGARGGRIAGTLPPLDLVALTPAGLKSLLDDAGFEWRIVIVAACYAGAYADELDDDHTVVVAASAADKPSFGCEGRGDPTYFGDSLFGDGFARSDSLATAFDTARKRVAAHERERGLTPSEPLMHVGARIAPMIRHLRRFGGSDTVTASARRSRRYQLAFDARRLR